MKKTNEEDLQFVLDNGLKVSKKSLALAKQHRKKHGK